MMIAIGLLALVLLPLSNRRSQWRMNRSDRLWLNLYEHKARCEGAFPFDYLSR
ncbi:MAG: hypothetical protein LAP39_25740 [Acidobacteriia bacterium]|nr:hypothetical protein [Terriglobia bacterium]